MRELKNSFFLKALAFFLCSVTAFVCIVGAFAMALMLSSGIYTESCDNVVRDSLENVAAEYAWKIGCSTADILNHKNGEIYIDEYTKEGQTEYLEKTYPNVYFEISLSDGTPLLSNYSGESFRFTCDCIDRLPVYSTERSNISSSGEDEGIFQDTAAPDETDEAEGADETDVSDIADETDVSDETDKAELSKDTDTAENSNLTDKTENTEANRNKVYPMESVYVDATEYTYYGEKEIIAELHTTVYVKEAFETYDKMAITEWLINKAYTLKIICPVLTVICFFLFVIFFVFLMCAAGRKKGFEKAVPGVFEKIPFDIILAVLVPIVILEAEFICDFISYQSIQFALFLTAVLVYADILILLGFFYTLAVRCKTSTLIKNTVIYVILRFIFRGIRKAARFVYQIIKGIPLVWKSVLAAAAVCIAELFTVFLCILWQAEYGWLLLWWFLEKLLLVPAVIYFAIQMKRLKSGGKEISSGNLFYRIDTTGMPSELREHGENLNSISDGMAAAVEEKLKSERLKTELITNVSHDIKTPLTSIINYVDLLKKEKPENEVSREYLEVLDRQCARLKKLIEDLVEASKASTGNISVNLKTLEAGVLIGQVLGEYESRAEAAELTVILTKPDEPLYFLGDGRLMWRVLDNLMSNICKYAQGGTRVYVSLEDGGESVIMTLKNISKYPLNISGDELMERFVRGDSSRSTEGSGLGLSIAGSLAALQNGSLTLSVDGDLFKATVVLPKE